MLLQTILIMITNLEKGDSAAFTGVSFGMEHK